jgi:hypothetical protein
MPIALLLEETTLAFRFGAKKLDPWSHLVAVEELLIDRARSAFLVRWFGSGIPLRGSYLRIAVDNLVALRNQYLLAKASVEAELSGPNLTEPLAGLAGELVGVFLADGWVFALVAAMRKTSGWLAFVAKVLLAYVGVVLGIGTGGFVTGLVVGVGTPVGLLGGLYLGTKDENSRAVVTMLGAAARALEATRLFVDQLLGPREKVANPIVRQVLTLLDGLAGLVPQMLGALAFVVVEIGPRLVPLAAQMVAFGGLVDASLKALSFIFDDLLTQLLGLFKPDTSPLYGLKVVFKHVMFLLANLWPPIKALIADTKAFFSGLFDRLKPTFKDFFGATQKTVEDAIDATPFSLQVKAAKMMVAAAKPTFAAMGVFIAAKIAALVAKIPFAGGKSTPGAPMPKFPMPDPKRDLPSPTAIIAAMGGPPFGVDDIIPLFRYESRFREWLFGPTLSKEAKKGLERVRHPASVFAAEEKALTKSLGKPPKQALEDELEIQRSLGELFADIVGRVLPPAMRAYMDKVIGGFASLHDSLAIPDKKNKGKKPAKAEEFPFPTRDLDDNGLLYPVIHRLTVKASGLDKPAVEAFEERLLHRLQEQVYLAPKGA